MVLWGTVPVVMSLYVGSRQVWRLTWTISLIVVVGVGLSWVYLGVHWPTDVLGGGVAGGLLLTVLVLTYRRPPEVAL